MIPPLRKLPRFTTLLALVASLAAAGALYAHLKVERTEPESGTTVSQPVRSLRVWFTQTPDVALSQLELEGPEGAEVEVTGLHTMGYKDLMARVAGRMPDGEYTAKWQTAGDDGHVQKGEWTFTLDRSASGD